MKVRYTYEGVNDCFHNFGVVVRGNDKNGNIHAVQYGFREFDVESWYGQGFLARFICKYGEEMSHAEFEDMFADRNYTHPGKNFYGDGDSIYRFCNIRKAIDGIWSELNGSNDVELLDGFTKMKDVLWDCLYGMWNSAVYISLDRKVMDNADVSAMSEEIAIDVENRILERLDGNKNEL